MNRVLSNSPSLDTVGKMAHQVNIILLDGTSIEYRSFDFFLLYILWILI